MPERTDQDLLLDFARTGCDEAFAELVHRHVDLVYSTAFRLLRNASLAEEVTQRTFIAVAQNAQKLSHRSAPTGWLHETARNFAIATVRSEERRRRREKEAADLCNTHVNASVIEPDWERLAPDLDDALARLSQVERETILWRYFERKTAREIGQRLGLTEEAAQKRALRALDRLRTLLAERGVAVPSAGLAGLLSIQAVQSAPVGLTASILGVVGAADTTLKATSTIAFFMASKAKFGLAATLLAGLSTSLVIEHRTNSRLTQEITSLRQQTTDLDQLRAENQRLAAAQIEPQEIEKREREKAELIRLRSEVNSLRARASESRLAPEANSKPNRSVSAGPEGLVSTGPDAPLVPVENWANVGLDSPLAAFQTLSWAKANRDTNAIAKSVAWSDDKERARIETVFAAAPESVRMKYGSADAYILSLFDHPQPDASRRVTGFRVLSEDISDNDATLLVEERFGNGGVRHNLMKYVRIGNEWRQTLDFDGPGTAKLSAGLAAEAQNP